MVREARLSRRKRERIVNEEGETGPIEDGIRGEKSD